MRIIHPWVVLENQENSQVFFNILTRHDWKVDKKSFSLEFIYTQLLKLIFDRLNLGVSELGMPINVRHILLAYHDTYRYEENAMLIDAALNEAYRYLSVSIAHQLQNYELLEGGCLNNYIMSDVKSGFIYRVIMLKGVLS